MTGGAAVTRQRVIPEDRRVQRLSSRSATLTKRRLLRQSGFRCKGCGARPWERDGMVDGAHLTDYFTLDHRVPLARGGTNSEKNLWVLCHPCHDGKTNIPHRDANLTDEQWRERGMPQLWAGKLMQQMWRKVDDLNGRRDVA